MSINNQEPKDIHAGLNFIVCIKLQPDGEACFEIHNSITHVGTTNSPLHAIMLARIANYNLMLKYPWPVGKDSKTYFRSCFDGEPSTEDIINAIENAKTAWVN